MFASGVVWACFCGDGGRGERETWESSAVLVLELELELELERACIGLFRPLSRDRRPAWEAGGRAYDFRVVVGRMLRHCAFPALLPLVRPRPLAPSLLHLCAFYTARRGAARPLALASLTGPSSILRPPELALPRREAEAAPPAPRPPPPSIVTLPVYNTIGDPKNRTLPATRAQSPPNAHRGGRQ